MGGFDSYARSIYMQLGRPMLGDDTLDRLQAALLEAAPEWSARARIARVGQWSHTQRIDMNRAGALDEAVRSVLSGGPQDRKTVGDTFPEPIVEITGTERSVHLYLRLDESLRATRRWSGDTDSIIFEANKRTVGDEPNATWIERVFESLCRHVRPTIATASTLGERVSASKRYGMDSHDLEWLTFLGDAAVSRLGRQRVLKAPAESVIPIDGGALLILSDDPGPGRTVRYWRTVEAVRDHLDADAITELLRTRRETHHPTLVPQERATEGARAKVLRGLVGLKTPIPPLRSYTDTRFTGTGLTRPGAIAAGYRFERCTFDNVGLGSETPEKPVIVRDSALIRAKAWAVFIGWVVAEDCTVDGFEGAAIWPVDTLLLRHVTLSGAIGAVDIRDPRQLNPRDSVRRAVHEDFYAKVDWALDIRGARFRRADLSGVPGRLVRRDPATQVLVTLERLTASRWQTLDFRETAWNIGFEEMESANLEAVVFVAEPRGRRFDDKLRLIDDLRRTAIAEPD